MSSYNENLHSSVVSSLDTQELELQKVKSKLDASMFSLYYAQGDRITTAEKLEITTKKYQFEQKVHEQAITNSDLSTNVLTSSTNVKAYAEKSVSNTAVAAANVQIAANAILKLTSDAGSIFSIVSAADFGTEIYTQSKNAYELMNITAYTAELTSQHSMEASQLMAEVSSNTLDDKATTTDASVKNLLNVTSAQFDTTTQELSSENEKLATANSNEKKAEGVLEDTSVAYNATFQAYQLNNSELNLDVKVSVPTSAGDRTNYTVSFLPYISPFKKNENGTIEPNTTSPENAYPVEDYYVMLVKNSKSNTFSVNNAEDIVTKNDRDRFYQISPKSTAHVEVTLGNQSIIDFELVDGPITQNIYTSQLKDTDGDPMDLGTKYVVVVFVTLKNNYKKTINTFDDYMTAPSRAFTLQNKLNEVYANNIHAIGGDEQEVINISDNISKGSISISKEEIVAVEKIKFQVLEKPMYNVQYRGIFLPDNTDLIKDLLTVEGLVDLEKETNLIEEIANFYDPKISGVQKEINRLNSDITGLETQIEENKEIINDDKTKASEKKKLEKQNGNDATSLVEKKILRDAFIAELALLKDMQANAIDKATKTEHIKPGFFFNLTTAEQIPAGSYTPINKVEADPSVLSYLINEINADGKDIDMQQLTTDLDNIVKDIETLEFTKFVEDVEKLLQDTFKIVLKEVIADYIQFKNDLELIHDGYKSYSMEFEIKPETTDNFGNRLIDGNKYIPAIIAISDDTVEVNNQFTNSLSDFQHTNMFIYADTNPNATY